MTYKSLLRYITSTVIPWYSLASENIKPGTHHILMRKNASEIGTCLPHATPLTC